MSTSRLNKKGSVQKSNLSKQEDSDRADFLSLEAGHPHVQSQDLIEQENPIEFSHQVGSDGGELRSPKHGVNTNNSNESVPVRSAQDISASQQSYNYDFLYDPEVARQGPSGSAASIKFSGSQSNQSMAAQSATLSPHVFMLSTEGNDQRNNRSAQQLIDTSAAANRNSSQSGKGNGSSQNRHQRHSSNTENVAPMPQPPQPMQQPQQLLIQQFATHQPQAQVSKYVEQRAPSASSEPIIADGQEEPQYIEEEYYIEEEVEESGEEDVQTYNESHCVETIKEVSSDQENQSPGNSEANQNEAMGTIMQTASLSAGKQRNSLENGQTHFSHSQKRINASDFKDFNRISAAAEYQSSSSKNTDSNMASLVFRPRDSDLASLPHQQTSITSNKHMNLNIGDSGRKRNSDQNEMQHHFSHPSFGPAAASNSLQKLSQAEKWNHMAEKCAIKLLVKNLHVQLSKVHDVFQRKQIQQEVILSSLSQMQLKSFLDISLNSSVNLFLTIDEREGALEELRGKSIAQIKQELVFVTERLTDRLGEYFKGESEILKSLAQERERNQFLEQELSAREDRIKPVMQSPGGAQESEDQDMAATEQFINELEVNLQEARAELLSAKLQISDQNVEIANLKTRINVQSGQVNQILEERRNFEESFDNLRSQLEVLQSEKLELSQMIRERESSLQPAQLQPHLQHAITNINTLQADSTPHHMQPQQHQQHMAYQQNINNQSQLSDANINSNNDLKRQIDALNRQVYEASKRQESLHMVETNLIEKLDKKELENMELKEGLFEMKQENQMKTEVISKAQKIIERLTSKSESDDNVMKRLNEDNESHKREINEKQKVVQMLNEQLGQVQAKQSHNQVVMQDTMAKELEDVRNAVREYQLELANEKSNYMAQIASLETQLNASQEEKTFFASEQTRREDQARAKVDGAEAEVMHMQERLRKQEDLTSEVREELKKQVALVEANAKNQIQYLQNRIKEIVEETQDSNRGGDNGLRGASKGHQGKTNHSLLISVKKELEQMCQEVLQVRETLREEGSRGDVMVNQKASKFDEFRLSVLDQLILWDEKTAELACLAERYSGALEEQRKLFSKLKLVVKEKDQVIVELNRQLIMREQSQYEHFEQMKNELLRSNQVMKDEMLGTVALLEQKALMKEKDCLEMEEAKISFRKEFTATLEERNFYEQELKKATDRLQFQEAELDRVKTSMSKQCDLYSEILNIRSMQMGHNTIELALRNLADDCKRYSSEMVAYRDKYHTLERDRDEERKLLNQKVASLEEQYASLQKQAIDKEEEQQLEFVDRENELIKDVEKAQAYADKTEAELKTRERQLKKIQDKLEEDDQKFSDAQSKIEIVAQEKQEAERKSKELEMNIQRLEEQIEQLNLGLKQQEDLTNIARADRDQERSVVDEKIDSIHQLEEEIRRKEVEVESQKHQVREMENKLRQVEQRSMQTSKDLQEVYQELTQVKGIKSDIEAENQNLVLDIQGLKLQLDNRQAELGQKDVEIQQYQKTVMRQTRELESTQEKIEIIGEQKQRLANFDETMQRQAETIDKLKLDLRRPSAAVASTQTIDSGMLELQYARQEVIKSQQCQEIVYQENVQLKEAVQRGSYEICRLIEDKRELEDLIEKLNKNVSYGQTNNLMASGKMTFDQTVPGNTSSANAGGDNMMNKVLNEKENYIGTLENEITEMRKEIEIQREQLLQAEAQTICAETKGQRSPYMSLGGGPGLNGSFFQSQSQQQPMAALNPYHDAPVVPSSPQYLLNNGFGGFLNQQKEITEGTKSSRLPNNHAPLRSTSGERGQAMPNHYGSVADGIQDKNVVPYKLNAQTINYSTFTRSLTPMDQAMTSSGPSDSKSGYFQNQNSSMNLLNNQTVASQTQMLNQTNYNSSYGGGGGQMRNQDASYLNAGNQSSVMMMGPGNYGGVGLNTSLMTNQPQPMQQQSQSMTTGPNNQTQPSPDKDNSYGAYIHA